MSKYEVSSGPYFLAFGLSLRIQSEYGKIRARKTPYLDTFRAVERVEEWVPLVEGTKVCLCVVNYPVV